ncbi:hypothetical protein GGR57DRAFT_501531 [Xylariaceae sp. FL1272]|nr:hypothetical protein GGR57DRAFT_501531 [Xylariaceae sp. FL1272]
MASSDGSHNVSQVTRSPTPGPAPSSPQDLGFVPLRDPPFARGSMTQGESSRQQQRRAEMASASTATAVDDDMEIQPAEDDRPKTPEGEDQPVLGAQETIAPSQVQAQQHQAEAPTCWGRFKGKFRWIPELDLPPWPFPFVKIPFVFVLLAFRFVVIALASVDLV